MGVRLCDDRSTLAGNVFYQVTPDPEAVALLVFAALARGQSVVEDASVSTLSTAECRHTQKKIRRYKAARGDGMSRSSRDSVVCWNTMLEKKRQVHGMHGFSGRKQDVNRT